MITAQEVMDHVLANIEQNLEHARDAVLDGVSDQFQQGYYVALKYTLRELKHVQYELDQMVDHDTRSA